MPRPGLPIIRGPVSGGDTDTQEIYIYWVWVLGKELSELLEFPE